MVRGSPRSRWFPRLVSAGVLAPKGVCGLPGPATVVTTRPVLEPCFPNLLLPWLECIFPPVGSLLLIIKSSSEHQ